MVSKQPLLKYPYNKVPLIFNTDTSDTQLGTVVNFFKFLFTSRLIYIHHDYTMTEK